MTISNAVLIYVMLWVVTLFLVLPWGVKPADVNDLGHATGAPLHPRIGLKLLITTLGAGVLWGGVFFVLTH